ncbi:MAG: hypothetical protein ACI9G1_003614 [Pirellulaceae bacterium]|jgi:hypothetical protein
MSQSIRVFVFGTFLLASSVGTMLLWADTPPVANPAAEKQTVAGQKRRLREGDSIEDRTGYFRENGDRLMFSLSDTATDQTFRVLENLALERVSRVMDEKPGKREWNVSGTISEYRGKFYVLLTRAILRTKRLGP